MNHFLPLVNRGAVARFFDYHTQEEIADIAKACGEQEIKVYDYDFQVHTRTDALIGGKFDITLPTSESTKSYHILKKDGTYQKLVPHSTMSGWNVATVTVADHGNVPFTVDLTSVDRPVVGDGSNRTIPRALPATDDLIGVRIVEVVMNEILSLFKDEKLPPNAVVTEKGIKYTDLFVDRGTILSDSMLDGWRAINVTPSNGDGWRANIVNGAAVITFNKDVYDDQTVTVTLQKIGSLEMKDIEVIFAGERESIIDKIIDRAGCNAGIAMLALLVLYPLFIRRRG
jgi:Synergist-CTERM protein sorting domain-containing protein